MRAAYVEQLGPADEIRYGEFPEPTPGDADVLVDVLASPVNPVDTFVRSGAYRTPVPLPLVVGRDLVGRVRAVGADVTDFAPGDLVWCNSLGHDGRQGAASERALVPTERLYHLPADVDPVAAAAVLHPAATAWLALFVHARLRAGETLVVLGGAGNVGATLLTLAADAEARVVTTCSADDAPYCTGLGAALVIDYRSPDLAAQLREACPVGADVVIDTAGHNDLTAAVDLLATRGRIVLLAGGDARPVLPVGPLYFKDGSVLGFVISRASVADLAAAARAINDLLPTGRLVGRRVERLPLSHTAEAHRRMEAGQLHGRRVVLIP